MTDIILESIRSLVLAGIILYLLQVGRGRSELSQTGWRFVIAGFFLLFFGSTVDITDNFESLNRFVVIGDTPVQAFLEKMVGFLGGFLVLAIGLVRWIPTITTVEEIKKFQIATEGVSEHVMFTDPDGIILYANKAAEKMTGYSVEEMIGKRPSLWGNNMDREFYAKMWKTIKEDKKHFSGELRNTRKNGEEYIIELRISPILDKNNDVKFFVGIERDITEQRKAEKKIKNLAKFPSENPNPVFRISIKDQVVLYANSASEPLLKNWNCKVGRKAPDFCWEKAKKSIQSNRNEIFDVSFKDKTFSFVAAPITDGGYVNLYGRDVTKERKIEEMKSDFVSLVSHQLKTPVAEMRGFVDIMLSGLAGELTKKQKEYLLDMDTISSRNYKLISNLLDVSQLDRGIITVDIKPVTLTEVIDFVVEEYGKKAKEKGITLQFNKPDKKITVLADKDKLIEAITNVVHNSIKFTEKGSITVTISSDRDFGIVEVRDTGRGMSQEVLSHLFKKERVLSGPPEAGSGAGIGLYITKSFMELQNGDVIVRSTPGKGSTFIFKIPIAKV